MNSSPSISMKKLQAADRILGRIACLAARPLRALRRSPVSGADTREILLIKFWGLGSLQLLTPAVTSLRARYPQARLTLLTLRGNREFARGLGCFDAVETLDVSGAGWVRVFIRILALFRQLRAAGFDRVYDFEFFTRFSAMVSLATCAPVVRGFDAPSVDRGGFHTDRVPFNRYWHVARNFRTLAEGEDGNELTAEDVTPYRVSPQAEESVRALFADSGLDLDGSYSVLNANAGELSLERRWPIENFAELARTLIHEDGQRVVLIGSTSEAPHVQELDERIGAVPAGHLLNLAGKLDVHQLAAVLSHADCTVSNDSGPMHVSAALGTPTLGLFGPETPLMYRPLGVHVRVLWDPPPCSPCINVHDNKVATCIHGRPECLVNISVDRVLEEHRSMLCKSLLRPVGPRQVQPNPRLARADK